MHISSCYHPNISKVLQDVIMCIIYVLHCKISYGHERQHCSTWREMSEGGSGITVTEVIYLTVNEYVQWRMSVIQSTGSRRLADETSVQ